MNAVNVAAAKADEDVEDQEKFLKYGAVDEFYQIGKEIGRGSYGTVKNCIHKKTQRVYAVKMIKTSTQTVRKNVLREIEVMRALGSHHKLVTLYDAYQTPFEISMILEFVPGGELFERIVAEEYLMEDDAVDYVRQILEALQFMHKKKIVHLDLKPENILCVSMNSHDIKLVDFGLARDLSSVEEVKSSFGTPDFVAPEVIRMKPVSYASDLWSLGVVTYVLLSGLMPFSGDDDTQTLVKVAKADWDFDDDCFEELSEDAKDFIEGLLVKDPRERLTIEDCFDHSWIKDAKDTVAKIHTQKHKAFMAKRRWKKTVNALLAVRRMSLSPLFSQTRRSSMDPSLLKSSSELDEEQQSPDRKRFSPATGLGVDLLGRGHVGTRSCFDLDMETIVALQKKADKAMGKNEPTDGRENDDGAESQLSDSECSDELEDDKETKDGSLPRQRARTVSGASSHRERKTSEVSIAIGDASNRNFEPVTFTFDSNELQENDKRIVGATTAISTQTTRTNAANKDSAPDLRDAFKFTIDTTRQVQQPANFIFSPQKLTLQLDPSSTSDGLADLKSDDSEKIPTIYVNDELCHVNSPSLTLNNNVEKMDRREAKTPALQMSSSLNVATVSLVPDGVQSITVQLDDINNPLQFPANQVSCHLSRPSTKSPSNLIGSACLRLHRP